MVKKSKILTFKVNFLCQKWWESFYLFFIEDVNNKNCARKMIYKHNYWHFLTTSIFKPLCFLKFLTSFTQLTARLFNGLVVGFGPKGKHGRMCDSEVILARRLLQCKELRQFQLSIMVIRNQMLHDFYWVQQTNEWTGQEERKIFFNRHYSEFSSAPSHIDIINSEALPITYSVCCVIELADKLYNP